MTEMTIRTESATYQLVVQAMIELKYVSCSYDGSPRVVCPFILGYTDGEETVLVYQVAGRTKEGPIRPKVDGSA